ncbi:hypothetical protein CCH79_00020329 [Gambusia affinis]|uniref:Uncharacterized protein n=1 Tax=Gambusia affinis TaxID=33528 RepID=A0A315VSS5_GAMAF|nr:hypothetical protein CCH79_00020329 [Gambusia affinis]
MPPRPAERVVVLLLDACRCKNLHRFPLHPPGSDLPQSLSTLQDKVCELQTRFGSEEVSCQQTGGGAWVQGEEPLLATPTGDSSN